MVKSRQIYGEINNKTDMERVFTAIRGDIEKADSRSGLTELYKRAGYLITLTHAPSWEEKFGGRRQCCEKSVRRSSARRREESTAERSKSARKQTTTRNGGD